MYISKILRRFYKVDNNTYINLKKVLYVRRDNNSIQIKFEKEDGILTTNYCFHTNYINRKKELQDAYINICNELKKIIN